MVKKLFKHEAKYYLRFFILFEIVLFAVAIFTRAIMFFENDNIVYYLLQGSAFVLFGLTAIVGLIMATVLCISRFYKNFFTNEGYLTLTLPVSFHKHILVKLFSAVCYNFVITISIFVAFLITISGELLNEVFKATVYILNDLGVLLIENVDPSIIVNIILYVIEFIVITFASTIFGFLVFYSCIALGQLSKKNRIVMAFVYYFIYGVISEVLSTVFSIVYTLLETAYYVKLQPVYNFIAKNPLPSIHIGLIAILVITVGLCFGLYFIVHHIMSKKLNIE